MTELWLPLLPFGLFFAWLFLFGMRRGQKCPDCGDVLPSIQSPFKKTSRQWFEGGYLCPKCGCEADLAARKVPEGAGPSVTSILHGIALLALVTIPALILLTLLFRQ